MLTTKYTYLYRAMGALSCALVLAGIFLPWAAVTDGKIGPFRAGSNPSGWDLAYQQQLAGSTLNIGGAIFSVIFGMLVFAILGLIAMGLGMNGASFGYFLISTSVFMLIFMLVALPYIQQSIPVQEDPWTPEKKAEYDALFANASTKDQASKLMAQLNDLNATRGTVLEWKNLKLVPQFGCYLAVAGSVMAYVFSRFIASDSAKLDSYRKYSAILGQVHADGKVTTDEAAILARERQMLRLSEAEHEYIIRRTVADRATQDSLLAMHATPIDIERELRTREFDTYKRSLVQAYKDGKLTQDEADLLRTQREGLHITEADHDAMFNELLASGEIRLPKGALGFGTGTGPQPLPGGPPQPGTAQPSAGPAPPGGSPQPGTWPSPGQAPPGGPLPPAAVPPRPGPAQQLPSPPEKVSLLSGSLPAAPPPAPAVLPAPSPAPPTAAPVPPPPGPPEPLPPSSQVPPPPAVPGPRTPGQPAALPPSSPSPPPPVQGAAPPPLPPPVPGPEAPPTEPLKRVMCTKCGETIPIFTEDRPLELVCPRCGFKGMLRK